MRGLALRLELCLQRDWLQAQGLMLLVHAALFFAEDPALFALIVA